MKPQIGVMSKRAVNKALKEVRHPQTFGTTTQRSPSILKGLRRVDEVIVNSGREE